MKQSVFLILTLILLVGCSDRDDDLSGVNIRIKNKSSLDFDAVQVGAADMVHSNIAAGSFSDYLEYETAYSYAYIQIAVDDQIYILQPIDYVGETPLGNGFYTYVLNISEDGSVILDFKVD